MQETLTLNGRFRYLETLALCLILALAATLRLANVADNPAWYTDGSAHR